MFRLDINVNDLVETLERVADAPRKEPVRNRDRWETTMREGTRRHFQRLESGGADQTALGGSVNWPTSRAKITAKTRIKMGVPPGAPFLRAGGDMMRAFTRDTETRVQAGQVTRLRYRTRRPHQEAKARKHQLGGTHEARFFGQVKPNFPFPQRQFLYWDERMEREILGYLADAIRTAVRRS